MNSAAPYHQLFLSVSEDAALKTYSVERRWAVSQKGSTTCKEQETIMVSCKEVKVCIISNYFKN